MSLPTYDTRIAKIESEIEKLTTFRSQEEEQSKNKAELVSSTHVEDLM